MSTLFSDDNPATKVDLDISPIRPHLTKINVNLVERSKKKQKPQNLEEIKKIKEKYSKIVQKPTKLIRIHSRNKDWKDVVKANTQIGHYSILNSKSKGTPPRDVKFPMISKAAPAKINFATKGLGISIQSDKDIRRHIKKAQNSLK